MILYRVCRCSSSGVGDNQHRQYRNGRVHLLKHRGAIPTPAIKMLFHTKWDSILIMRIYRQSTSREKIAERKHAFESYLIILTLISRSSFGGVRSTMQEHILSNGEDIPQSYAPSLLRLSKKMARKLEDQILVFSVLKWHRAVLRVRPTKGGPRSEIGTITICSHLDIRPLSKEFPLVQHSITFNKYLTRAKQNSPSVCN